MLPRIPKVDVDFAAFADAGRRLADLHVGYERSSRTRWRRTSPRRSTSTPSRRGRRRWLREVQLDGARPTGPDRLQPPHHADRHPEEAYRYLLGSRSAIDGSSTATRSRPTRRLASSTTPTTGPASTSNPRYIIDLLKRIVTVSVETMKIVDSLPAVVSSAP